ncbi:hypothetical protein RJ640_017843 [Escallonia rubra]|uniref:F-box domain-containing protein n=1 Tax=Escallonia rubra TaxID=112253 RepID=A0AA88RB49_9ASTE|nr:hypothetical protein RJ640_017843 [Escallonia rubra]
MATGFGKSKMGRSAMKDVISNLPTDVIENILGRVPIQEAVKTSILSRKWLLNWSTLPELVFDREYFDFLKSRNSECDFVRGINKVLLLHSGPILKFVLSIPDIHIEDREDIDQWILLLSRKGVKELTFQNLGISHRLPTYLFSCLLLTHLKLCSCDFAPPPKFRGFPNLISLEFHLVRFPNFITVNFFSCFQSLEMLVIESSDYLDAFDVDSPNGYIEPADVAAEAALSNAQKTALRESRKKDKKALFLIFQDAKTSKEAWEILQKSLQGVEKAKKVKIKLAVAMDEVEENVVATEVAIELDVVHAVYAVDEDVVDNLLI